MMLASSVWPCIAALLGLIVFIIARRDASRASRLRVRQLHAAADLLEHHAATLDVFLSDSDSPADLKQLLLSLSEAMTDQESVARRSVWAALKPDRDLPSSPEVDELYSMLIGLQVRRPDLHDAFVASVWNAVASAAMRWPPDDSLTSVLTRLVSTPRQDVSTAVTAATVRAGTPFIIRAASTATA